MYETSRSRYRNETLADIETKVDERHLIRRILSGERELYAQLAAAAEWPLRGYAARLVQRPADLEDIVQAALWKAYRHLDQFRGDSSFNTWLFRIAYNEAQQFHRRHKREASLEELVDRAGARVPSAVVKTAPVIDGMAVAERNDRLARAIAQIPAMYQQVLRLRFVDGCSIAETARRLDVTIDAAKTRQYRACELVKRQLARAECRRRRVADETRRAEMATC